METIAVIHNPYARKNIREKSLGNKLESMLGDGDMYVETRQVDELDKVAGLCREKRIDVIGVNGGDGSTHAVLTAFKRVYGSEKLPGLLLMRGGTMNTVTRSLGLTGHPLAILEQFLVARTLGSVGRMPRQVLRVNEKYGFIFGLGVVSRFLDAYYKGRGRGSIKALSLVGRIISGIVLRSDDIPGLFAPEPLTLSIEGGDPGHSSYMAVLASTVREVGLGCALTSRCDEEPGSFHLIVSNVPAMNLLRNIVRLWTGKSWPHPGLIHHGPARRLRIDPPGTLRWTLDGDMYETEGALEVAGGPTVEIIILSSPSSHNNRTHLKK